MKTSNGFMEEKKNVNKITGCSPENVEK